MTTCEDELAVLRVALGDMGKPNDIVRADAMAMPTVAEDGPNGSMAMLPLAETSAFWRVGWRGKAPSSALVHRWYGEAGRSLEPCLSGRGDDRRLASLLGALPDGMFDRSTRNNDSPGEFTVSRPTLKHGYALVLYSLAEKGLGGRTELVLLKRAHDGWRKVGSRILSES